MSTSFPPAAGRVLASLTIFVSAFLLFAVEPLFAKRILPWFGGSAAVWVTCLVFYQVALLGGYLYARLLASHLRGLWQAVIHVALLAASLMLLPVGPTAARWQPATAVHPAGQIFWMMSATLGLPFVLLSATSPLVQQWLARAGDRTPYGLFALSNFASLAALLAYPLLIEPTLGIEQQRVCWSAGYVVFAGCCGVMAVRSRGTAPETSEAAEPIPIFRPLYWFALAACGSMLLLAVTNHITENVAAVPLLWVLPLAVYLLTFILGFSGRAWYQRGVWMRLLAVALGVLAYGTYNVDAFQSIQKSLPVYLGGLFVCCLFCQGELYFHRPAAGQLTGFYLAIAAGGATGAIFVGLIAPQIFRGVYELPFTLLCTAILALATTWSENRWPVRALWLGVAACMAVVMVQDVRQYNENMLLAERSFYGALRVVQPAAAGPEQIRTLYHGTIQHGAEYVWPERQRTPITYYGASSGVAILLRECLPEGAHRVAVVGLGTGTLAAFGQAGDTFRFYEINPQVIDIAKSLFFFTRESAAKVEIVEGDARLSLGNDNEPFDVIVLDAFSGDAIPVHLMTREAMALYKRLLKPGGTIAFHVSNTYLKLAPVVRQLAEGAGLQAMNVVNHDEPENRTFTADWVLVTNNPAVLDNEAMRIHMQPIEKRVGLREWTDEFNSLWEVVKWGP